MRLPKWPVALPDVRRFFLTVCLTSVAFCVVALSVRADDAPEPYDARIQNYDKTVQLVSSSSALTWLLLIVLGVVCLGVLFKDARRSHLD